MAEAQEVQEVPPGGPEALLPIVSSGPVGEGGGVLSPLSGAYLLVVLSEPMSEAHKTKMVQKLKQGMIHLFEFSTSTYFILIMIFFKSVDTYRSDGKEQRIS